jgi:hypothetical protein
LKVIAPFTGKLKESVNLISLAAPIEKLIKPEPSVK